MTDLFLEGVNDPGIFKVIFLAGGPGSGKSFVVNKTALTVFGLRVVNSDPAFEQGLKKAGMSTSPEDIWSDKGQKIRVKATNTTKNKQIGLINGRIGIVVDGTGKDVQKILTQKSMFEKLGYESAMIFVNTNLETAIARDLKRARTIGKEKITPMWQGVQNNLGKFQSAFKSNMFIIDNSDGADWQRDTTRVFKRIGSWTKKIPTNKIAKSWISDQKKDRGMSESLSESIVNKLDKLKKAYSTMPDRLQPSQIEKMKKTLSKFNNSDLQAIANADIKWLSTVASTMSSKFGGKLVKANESVSDLYRNSLSSLISEDAKIDEGSKQVLAHGGKGQYKVVSTGGAVDVVFKGKVVGKGDYDRGADSFFISMKGQKGQKSFDDAQDIADYFAKNKIKEDLDEAISMRNSINQYYYVDPKGVVGAVGSKDAMRKMNVKQAKDGNKGGSFSQNFKKYKVGDKIKEEVELDEAKFSPKDIKMAIGIASDPRYKGGNMSGAVKAIDKIKKGLSDHPQVAAVLKRQNEETVKQEGSENMHTEDKKVSKASSLQSYLVMKEASSNSLNSAAKELDTYAKKFGGMDKRDFMNVAADMKKGLTTRLAKTINGLDTEPRDKIAMVLKKHIGQKETEKYLGIKFFEEVELDEMDKNCGCGKTPCETYGSTNENKKAELAKKLAKTAQSSKKGKEKVSLKKAPWDKKEEVQEASLDEGKMSPDQIEKLKQGYESLRGKKISAQMGMKISRELEKLDKSAAMEIAKADIPFVSTIAINKLMMNFNMSGSAIRKLIGESVEELVELTKAEKDLISKMYDKKGNLTPLGQKVMDHGKKEELSPKQKKIDKNKNGKIDGSDLRALRKENKDEYEDHMMYDPKTGKGRMTKSYEDHLDLKKKGWGHEKTESITPEFDVNVLIEASDKNDAKEMSDMVKEIDPKVKSADLKKQVYDMAMEKYKNKTRATKIAGMVK
jgi:hypothetical protein